MFLFQAGLKSNESFRNVSSESASRKVGSKGGALPCSLGDAGSLGTGFRVLNVSAPATRLRGDSVALLSYHQKSVLGLNMYFSEILLNLTLLRNKFVLESCYFLGGKKKKKSFIRKFPVGSRK